MNSRFRDELPLGLAVRVGAVDAAPPPASVERAQARLLARLGEARHPARSGRIRWLATAGAAVLAMAVVAVPLLTGEGRAFAAVQAYFRNFETLSMRVEQRVDGRLLQTSHTVVDDRGVLRTDVGTQLSVVVDPPRKRVLVLSHRPREATLMPLQATDAAPGAKLDWLGEIRQFRGQARRLDATRVIDGRTAHGWTLELESGAMVLWADPSGLPLMMESSAPGGLAISYRFRFDAAVPAGHLSSDVPAGYERVEPDPH